MKYKWAKYMFHTLHEPPNLLQYMHLHLSASQSALQCKVCVCVWCVVCGVCGVWCVWVCVCVCVCVCICVSFVLLQC